MSNSSFSHLRQNIVSNIKKANYQIPCKPTRQQSVMQTLANAKCYIGAHSFEIDYLTIEVYLKPILRRLVKCELRVASCSCFASCDLRVSSEKCELLHSKWELLVPSNNSKFPSFVAKKLRFFGQPL